LETALETASTTALGTGGFNKCFNNWWETSWSTGGKNGCGVRREATSRKLAGNPVKSLRENSVDSQPSVKLVGDLAEKLTGKLLHWKAALTTALTTGGFND
jgi:hypothetical protein